MAQYHKRYSRFRSTTTPVVASPSQHHPRMASKLQSPFNLSLQQLSMPINPEKIPKPDAGLWSRNSSSQFKRKEEEENS